MRALGGIKRGDASAGAGADVDEAASIAKGTGYGVDDNGDLGQRFFDGGCDAGIFMIDDASDFES